MKTRLLKLLVSESKQRRGVTLLLCVALALSAFMSGAAQLRNQRRVTGLQLGEAAEGARVTIVSDSALSDYEAFRRGEFFYVKIPLADFTSPVPHFRAAGLESVQVQKVGDSLVVSFRLQPGATARVDQHGNRLDVLFSAPNRSPYTAANSGRDSRTSADQGRDAAGPMPPGSVTPSRPRVVRETAGDESRVPQNPWVLTNPHNDLNQTSKRGARDQSTSRAVPVLSPSPLASPSSHSSPASVLAPGASSSYSPLTSATPTLAPASRPIDSSSGSGGFLNWKHRSTAALEWASANRLATLLGALILLSLILYLGMALRSRQKRVVKVKGAKAPKVQPKYSADGEVDELPRPKPEVVSDRGPRPSHVQDQPDVREPRPALVPAASAKMSSSDEWVLARPTIASPTAEPDEHSSDEEEREVFEL